MSPLQRIYREVDARASHADHAEGPARAALLTGVLTSGVLLALGLLLVLLTHESRPDEPPDAAALLRGVVAFHGVSLLYLGLIVLAATPVIRVLVMITVYARKRERFMLTVSIGVLLLLALSLFLGTG